MLKSDRNAIGQHPDLLKVILLEILMQAEQDTHPGQPSTVATYQYTVIRNFQQLVERHFTEKRLPKEYADMLYITPNHLNALCKTHLGMQAGEVVRSRILLEAKRLLVSKNRNVAEIAYALNFNDASYFTRFFRKMAGVTPEEFRKSIHR